MEFNGIHGIPPFSKAALDCRSLVILVIQGGALSRTDTLQWAAREELLSHWNPMKFIGIPPFAYACKTLRFLGHFTHFSDPGDSSSSRPSTITTLQWAAREELLSHWNPMEFNGIQPFAYACKTLRNVAF